MVQLQHRPNANVGTCKTDSRSLIALENTTKMGSTEVPLEYTVPIINISEIKASGAISGVNLSCASTAKTVKEIRNACQQWGFFYVVGHGVDSLLIEELRKVSKDFFHSSKEFKKTVQRQPNNYRGYTDHELTKQRKDWKEAFDYGAEQQSTESKTMNIIELDAGKNQWPEGMDRFKDVLLKYFSAMHSLSSLLMDLIFMSLDVNPLTMRHHFDEDSDTSFCRLNYYPPCEDANNMLGVGPHSDSGVLTVLLQDDRVSSLQVEKDGRFHTVKPIQESFVVNIGDMMQVWSNGFFKGYESNVEPLEACVSNETPPRYRSVNWGTFRQGRILGDYADYGEEIQISQFEIK